MWNKSKIYEYKKQFIITTIIYEFRMKCIFIMATTNWNGSTNLKLGSTKSCEKYAPKNSFKLDPFSHLVGIDVNRECASFEMWVSCGMATNSIILFNCPVLSLKCVQAPLQIITSVKLHERQAKFEWIGKMENFFTIDRFFCLNWNATRLCVQMEIQIKISRIWWRVCGKFIKIVLWISEKCSPFE